MTPPERTGSWWVGLTRADLNREATARVEAWKQKQIGPLDTIGERLRETWEPRITT